MLFRKKQPRSCEYCSFSASITDGQVLCSKRGIRAAEKPCRSFRYDPVKRIPPKSNLLDFSKYKEEDFTL